MWRWLLRIVIVLVLVLAVVVGGIQYVLSTDMPRHLVVTTLQDSTGLRVDLDGFETGWTGTTRIESLTLSLPTSDTPLAEADRITVEHAGLLTLLMGGEINLQSLNIQKLTADVRQQSDGRWNLQQAADLIAAHSTGDGGPTALPNVALAAVTMTITTADGRGRTYDEITFKGESLPPTAMRFTAAVGQQVTLTGQLNAAGDLTHDLTLKADQLDTLATPWLDDPRFENTSVNLHWLGRFASGELIAEVNIESANVGDYAAKGKLTLTLGDAITIEPTELTLNLPEDQTPQTVDLRGGRIVYQQDTVKLVAVRAAAMNTKAQLTGSWSLTQSRGDLSAHFAAALDKQSIEHRGTLTANLSLPETDQLIASVTLNTRGRAPWGNFDAKLNLEGDGDPAGVIDWELTAPRGRLIRPDQPVTRFDGLSASGRLVSAASVNDKEADAEKEEPSPRPSPVKGEGGRRVLFVDTLQTKHPAALSASGHVDLDTMAWQAEVTADDFAPPINNRKFDIQLAARGAGEVITIETLEATSDGVSLSASGKYTLGVDPPLAMDLELQFAHALDDPTRPDMPKWAGHAKWTAQVTGDLQDKVRLSATGGLTLEGLQVDEQMLEPIAIDATLSVEDDVVSLSSKPFDVMGGRCELAGSYKLGQQSVMLTLDAQIIELGRLMPLVNPELAVEGAASTKVKVYLPRGIVERLRVEGDWSIENFAHGPYAIDRMGGRLSTRGRILRLDPIVLNHQTGRADGKVLYNLHDGRSLRAELNPQAWPVELPAAGLVLGVDGQVAVDVDVIERDVVGQIDLASNIHVDGGPKLGRLATTGRIGEATITLDEITGTFGGGQIGGDAAIDLTTWTNSTAALRFEGVDPTVLSAWQPAVRNLTGKLSGSITAAPATDPRAHEPLRLDANWRAAEDDQPIALRRIPLGVGSIVAFAGPQRVVVSESDIQFAGGTLNTWASLSPHAGQWYHHVRTTFERVDTNQIATALADPDEETKPVPGRVAGHFSVIGPVGKPEGLVGSGALRISESNFAGTDIIGGIFSIIGAAPDEPVGTGRATLRLERAALTVDQLRYANRGTEILLNGVIDDVAQGMQSPIQLNALASVRPFKDLPFLGSGDLDRLMRSFQSQLTTVIVTGTLAEPDVKSASLSATGQTLRRLLRGDDAQTDE